MKALLKQITRRFGYDILHLPTDPLVRRQMDLLRTSRIDLILDVGANTGQFAKRMRQQGYKGAFVSFEPLPAAYKQLEQAASRDAAWKAVNLAIGDFDGTTTIHVSKNSYSSSILDILPAHVESEPNSAYMGDVTVKVRKLDSIFDAHCSPGKNIFVKIDTQGFERQVFEGSVNSLDKILGFQMELSLVPLYQGETLMQEMIALLKRYGYKLKLIEGGHMNYETGELLQVEGYFYR
jgi:FkbM family methyltransferase